MPEILANRNSKICDRLERSWCEECAKTGSTDCIGHGGRLSEDTSVLGKRLGQDAYANFHRELEFGGVWDKSLQKPQSKRANAASSSPFSSNRGSFDRSSFDRSGFDRSSFDRSSFDRSSFDSNSFDSSSFDRSSFLRIPTPELVVSSRKAVSSSVAVPTPPSLVSQSTLEPPSFAIPSPTKFLIKPTPSLPTPIKPTASVPPSVPAVANPTTEAVARSNSSSPSDLTREQGPTDPDADENGCKEGGVRFRENLGKFVVEYRPPRFKWKLWMGTYATVEEGRRACDCARFYAGQDKGGFYFKDSPALFEDLGPLNRPFSMVSKDIKDKAFNVELKKRAKQVIRKVLDAQRSKQSVDATRPTGKKPLPEAIVQVLSARTNGRSDRLSSSSPDSLPITQESLPNSAVADSGLADSGHEENELAESAQPEVASGALDAGDSHSEMDHYSNLCSLSETSSFDPEFSSSSVLVSSFMLNPDHHDLQGCLQSPLDFPEDFDDFELPYVKLWNHDELP